MNIFAPVPDAALRPSCIADVRQVFAAVVRYPAEVFDDAGADLENELGIDSVKLGEVMSALKAHFFLTDADLASDSMSPDRLRTVSGIADAIDDLLLARKPISVPTPAKEQPVAAVPAMAEVDARPAANRLDEIIRIFSEVTRYPIDILTPDADLENDLGIDSIKLGEVFAALRAHFTLPPGDAWDGEDLRTIDGIARALGERDDLPAAIAPAPKQPATPAGATVEQRAPKPFAGKIALVTGSGHGIGRAFALKLASLGAEVIVNSFHSRDEGEKTAADIAAAGGKAHHIWASVANTTQLHRLFDEVEATCGGLDFMISNASNGMLAKVEEITAEHLEKAFRTNVIGLHLGALRAADLMKRRGGGRIVTLSTPGANRYMPYFGCMGPVKAAVESMTRYLAVELEPYNIRVNCISAGPIYGDLVKKWPDHQSLVPRWEAVSAGKRLSSEEDVANQVMFLLSDEAKGANGSILTFDAGYSLQLSM